MAQPEMLPFLKSASIKLTLPAPMASYLYVLTHVRAGEYRNEAFKQWRALYLPAEERAWRVAFQRANAAKTPIPLTATEQVARDFLFEHELIKVNKAGAMSATARGDEVGGRLPWKYEATESHHYRWDDVLQRRVRTEGPGPYTLDGLGDSGLGDSRLMDRMRAP